MKTKDLLEQFEKTYREEKQKEAEELHNALVSVLSEHKAEIQTVLYVLEMVKFELLEDRFKQLFASAPKPGEIRFGKPE
ncbi:hypothetical protein ASJ33_01445 [Dehalococcoides mccartyi]|uniref:Uncharacterized protein n=1 Tax=Dehalococcoides mccartyi TaxID=61435 RepID=A0A0V8M3X9_9CHLR|nr:hypothetical protein [Dehalococcoides mccartyi]APH11909.1 hypothetical protein ASJ33_01445 [Dehalococcoides mccartyi]KSV18493.1 hypothetical protein DA01_03055 [Dehalococcoides mccartyi]